MTYNSRLLQEKQEKLQKAADKILARNQKWAKTKVGKAAFDRLGDGYDHIEMTEWGLEHEIRMATKVLGIKRVKEIIKSELKTCSIAKK